MKHESLITSIGNRLGKALALATLLLVGTTNVFGQFLIEESCTGKTGLFTTYGNAYYTASLPNDPLNGDPEGSGWLRLTTLSPTYQMGYVLINGSYPSNLGLTVEFDFKAWNKGGNQADGFSIFLFDANNTKFTMGSSGGCMGYLPNSKNVSGMIGGYLGVALDEWGNYTSYQKTFDNACNVGVVPNTVTVTGPQPAGFKYYGHNTLVDRLHYPTGTSTRPSNSVYYRRVRLQATPATPPATGVVVRVFLKTDPAGSFTSIIGPVNIPNAMPAQLRVGFAGVTGSFTSYHEVQNVIVKTTGELSVYKSMSTPSCGSDQLTVVTQVSNGTLLPINGVSISDTMPRGFRLDSFTPPAGYVAGPTTSTPDGRIVYNATVNLLDLHIMKLSRYGTIMNLSSNLRATSSASILAPSESIDTDPTDNYATATANMLGKDMFSDEVWFFGNNTGVPEATANAGVDKTSKGIIFRKENGVYKAYDASGISKVNSWENSLSVSTPSCNGSFIFYVQHNQLFNSNHVAMMNGAIQGNYSTGDGLAAAYLGNNKYFLASVSNEGRGNLNYNIIDMNGDNGLGEKLNGVTIDNSGQVSEGIEMIPVTDTYNQYWLIYYLRGSNNTLVVKKVDGTNPSAPAITNVTTLNLSAQLGNDALVWRIQSDPTYTTLAMNVGTASSSPHHHFVNFDPTTGAISFNRSLSTRALNYSSYASYVFHGDYLYIAESQFQAANAYYIYQYKLSDWTLNSSFHIPDTPYAYGSSQYWQGGGMKMGPDGKIYFIRQSSPYTGVINNPDLSLNAPGNVDINGLKHVSPTGFLYNGMGLAMSTGLTPPGSCFPGANLPPIAVMDVASTDQYTPVRIKVLDNDSDPENGIINLNSAYFADIADNGVKGTVSIDANTKELIFSPSASYNFTEGEKVELRYVVKDIGIPVSMCDEGVVEITIHKTAVSSTQFTDAVWFFGANNGATQSAGAMTLGTDQTSKGMVFKMVNEAMTATPASNISKVNVFENSLSVSTPGCPGTFIFYASHNRVYNAKHEPMPKSLFNGVHSNSDGLASAYMGNNKYILFTITADAGNGNLKYYVVDMSLDNGYGSLVDETGVVVNNTGKVGEALELLPKVGTYNQYWLLYFVSSTNELVCASVSADASGNPTVAEVGRMVVPNVSAVNTGTGQFLRANGTYSKVAFVKSLDNNASTTVLFDFNPATGSLVQNQSITTPVWGVINYSVEFAPNGKYLYIADLGTATSKRGKIYQYDISVKPAVMVGEQQYGDMNSGGWPGGGMKLGPDGKIYITKPFDSWMAVIEQPNLAFTDAGGGLVEQGFNVGSSGGIGIGISTGLTTPWIDPPSASNNPPTAEPNKLATFKELPVLVRPLLNDSDEGIVGEANLILADAVFANPAQAGVKATIVVDGANKTVAFTPIAANIIDNEVITIDYQIKDKGAPISLCASGVIQVMVMAPPPIMLLDSCSFVPKLQIDLYPGFVYQWQFSADGTTSWIDVAGTVAGTLDARIKQAGFYRVQIHAVGNALQMTYSPIIELKLRTKTLREGTWYEAEIQ